MKKLWNRLNYRIRNRLYWHSLPVFLLAIGVIGAFSWIMFTHHVTKTMLNYQRQELAANIQGLCARAASEAMSLETQKGGLLEVGIAGRQRPGQDHCIIWPTDLLDTDLVRGLVFLEGDEPRADRPLLISFADSDSIVHFENHRMIDQWLLENQGHFWPGGQGPADENGDAVGLPVEIAQYRWHRLLVFAPVLLKTAGRAQPGPAEASLVPLLPILVQEDGGPSAWHGGGQEAGSGGEFQPRFQAVYFLDLQMLLQASPPDDWWCALDPQGRILAGSDVNFRPGQDIDGGAPAAGPGPLAELGGKNAGHDDR